jgi:hypothetical protein
MVAGGMMCMTLVALCGVLTAGLKATGLSRERQSANGLMNGTLEKIRSLPFNTVQKGMDTADVANTAGTADPDIKTGGCAGSAYCFGGEPLVVNANPAVDPLVPHRKSVVIGPATYNVASYVTYYKGDLTSGSYRVTVTVTWASNLAGSATSHVQAQTVIYAQQDCLSRAVHPFSGPCEPAFNASAYADAGSIVMSGGWDGIDVDHATLWTGRAASDATIEQIWRSEGLSQASGATLQQTAGIEQKVGQTVSGSRSDNDPAGTTPIYDSKALAAQSAGSASLSSGADSLTVSTTSGDSGQATSTTSASTSSSPLRNCPSTQGYSDENDTLPCGGSNARQAATVSAKTTLSPLGTFDLATVGPQSNASVAVVDRNKAPVSGKCVATSGDGCARAEFTRMAQDMNLAGVPSALQPSGFDYFVKIQGLADKVTSEAGIGTSAPSASITSGTIKYWDAGSISYVTVQIGQLASAITIPTLQLSNGSGATVSLSGTIQPGSLATTSTPASCGSTCTHADETATSKAPTVTLHYEIVVSGTTAMNLTYVADPGTIKSATSYTAAPTS